MNIYEIGVGNPSISRTLGNYTDSLYLFEANPLIYAELAKAFSNKKNCRIFNLCICGYDGQIEFCSNGDSSYVHGVASPAEMTGSEEYLKSFKKITVDCKTIKSFEAMAPIDILLLDMEGSEYQVLLDMVSRPREITIEMQNHNKTYINPHFDDILSWMEKNEYILKSKNSNEEDWTFSSHNIRK